MFFVNTREHLEVYSFSHRLPLMLLPNNTIIILAVTIAIVTPSHPITPNPGYLLMVGHLGRDVVSWNHEGIRWSQSTLVHGQTGDETSGIAISREADLTL